MTLSTDIKSTTATLDSHDTKNTQRESSEKQKPHAMTFMNYFSEIKWIQRSFRKIILSVNKTPSEWKHDPFDLMSTLSLSLPICKKLYEEKVSFIWIKIQFYKIIAVQPLFSLNIPPDVAVEDSIHLPVSFSRRLLYQFLFHLCGPKISEIGHVLSSSSLIPFR